MPRTKAGQTDDDTNSAFTYTPESYPEGLTLHWCLPSDDPDERTFTAREYESGALHLADLNYGEAKPTLEHTTTRERYTSLTAARASRRIKQGHAANCPFCSEATDFNYHTTRLPHGHNHEGRNRLKAEVLTDFQATVLDSCRPERDSTGRTFKPDINFSELTTDFYDRPHLEILTNTSNLRYAYPGAALPNWYSLAYAIAQNPWLEVKEVTEFETDHTRICLVAKTPNPDEYGEHYYRLLAQRDNAPYETKTPNN